MSDQDSFINEVTEAVRQDQLYSYVRRYGWIAALLIVLLVGAAAWNEWRKSQETAAAQATGDQLLAALQQDDAGARAAAMDAISVEGPAVAVTQLLQAAAQLEAGETEAARTALEGLAANPDVGSIYRDIAMFKAALLDEGTARASKLEALAQPGNPLRLLAEEQIALGLVNDGQTDEAVAALRAILEDAEVTQSLRDRAQTLIVALGAPLDPEAQETGQ